MKEKKLLLTHLYLKILKEMESLYEVIFKYVCIRQTV